MSAAEDARWWALSPPTPGRRNSSSLRLVGGAAKLALNRRSAALPLLRRSELEVWAPSELWVFEDPGSYCGLSGDCLIDWIGSCQLPLLTLAWTWYSGRQGSHDTRTHNAADRVLTPRLCECNQRCGFRSPKKPRFTLWVRGSREAVPPNLSDRFEVGKENKEFRKALKILQSCRSYFMLQNLNGNIINL